MPPSDAPPAEHLSPHSGFCSPGASLNLFYWACEGLINQNSGLCNLEISLCPDPKGFGPISNMSIMSIGNWPRGTATPQHNAVLSVIQTLWHSFGPGMQLSHPLPYCC